MSSYAKSALRIAVVALWAATSGCDSSGPVDIVDLCPEVPGNQTVLPCEEPEHKLSVSITSPLDGSIHVKGREFQMRVSVHEENAPRGSRRDTLWFIDGGPVECSLPVGGAGGPSSVTSCYKPGSHRLSVRVCNTADGLCGGDTISFVLRPEPDQILFSLVNGDYSAIYRVDEDGGAPPVPLTPVEAGPKYWPMLSPDGRTLIYTYDPPGECGGRLFQRNLDTGNTRVLIPAGVGRPTFSPNGQMLVFTGGCGLAGLFVSEADGSNIRRLLEWPDIGHGTIFIQLYAIWLNDEEILVIHDETLSLQPYTNRKAVARVRVVDEKVARVFEGQTTQSGGDLGLVMHDASGEWAVFTSPFVLKKLVLLRLDGSGEMRQLSSQNPGEYGDKWPFFCSGGQRVCFRSGSNGNEIRSFNLHGEDERLVLRFSSDGPGGFAGEILATSGWSRPR